MLIIPKNLAAVANFRKKNALSGCRYEAPLRMN